MLVLSACPTGDGHLGPTYGGHLSENHDNDWLVIKDGSSRDLYQRYYRAGEARADHARAALSDARPEVRRNAIVVLTAAIASDGMADYIAMLDDPDPFVASEAAATLATYGPQSLSGPENPLAMAALRAHVSAIRSILRSPNLTARYNAATALVAIVDTDVPLALLLGDEASLVRSVGLELAGRRELGPVDVAALDHLAQHDDDRQLRVRAVNIVGDRAPKLAESVLTTALARGDVDLTTSEIVTQKRMTSLIPAIVTLVKTSAGNGFFFVTLAELGATCAAPVMVDAHGSMDSAFAIDALRKLSGHPEWGFTKLVEWGKQQDEAQPPCKPR